MRFRDGAMGAIGRSGRGVPFLRDHDQYSVLARGGTIVASETTKVADGHYQLRQRATLLATFAALAARAMRLARGNRLVIPLLFFAIAWWWVARNENVTPPKKSTGPERLQALKDSIEKIAHNEIRCRVIHSGVGGVNVPPQKIVELALAARKREPAAEPVWAA